jgi:hypothetical protein
MSVILAQLSAKPKLNDIMILRYYIANQRIILISQYRLISALYLLTIVFVLSQKPTH